MKEHFKQQNFNNILSSKNNSCPIQFAIVSSMKIQSVIFCKIKYYREITIFGLQQSAFPNRRYLYTGHISNATPRKQISKSTFPSPKLHLYFQSRDNCEQTAITCDFECYIESRVASIIQISMTLPLVHTKLNPFRPMSHHCAHINCNTFCNIGTCAFI